MGSPVIIRKPCARYPQSLSSATIGGWGTRGEWAYFGEGGDRLVLGWLDVVDGHPAVRVAREVVGNLWDSKEAPVLVLEVHDGRPVV